MQCVTEESKNRREGSIRDYTGYDHAHTRPFAAKHLTNPSRARSLVVHHESEPQTELSNTSPYAEMRSSRRSRNVSTSRRDMRSTCSHLCLFWCCVCRHGCGVRASRVNRC